MTDEELIARLRDADLYNAQHYERDPLHKQAADRIEALTKERDAARQDAKAAALYSVSAPSIYKWRKVPALMKQMMEADDE